jgi:NTP pyrophosphatase (non-canonical NTP hydrolase)
MNTVNIDELAKSLHETAVTKGFWNPYNRMTEEDKIIFYIKQLMMITTEAAEVTEAIRKSDGDIAVVREIADIIIRTLDLYAAMFEHGYTTESLQYHLLDKAKYNQSRPDMHGVLA